LRQIHDAAHEFGVFTLDRTGRIVTWNALAATACGYSDEQIVGRSFACLYSEAEAADGQPAQALARSVAQGRFEEQAPRRRRDGSTFWADVRITAVYDGAGNHCGFACIVRDFSAHGSMEQELQSRLSQQEAITKLGASSLEGGGLLDLKTQAAMIAAAGLKANLANVLELDADGDLTLAAISEPAGAALVGMKLQGGRRSLSGYTLFSNEPVISEDLLAETRFQPHPKLLAYGARSGLSVAIKSKGVALGVVAAFARERRTFSQYDINFMQAIAHILASAMERAATEERLRHSEEYLRSVIENSSDIIGVLDPEGKTRFVSGSGQAMIGRKMADMIGKSPIDIAHPDDIPIRQRVLAQALAQPGVPVSAEIRVRLANSTYLECEVVMRALENIGGAPGVLVNSSRKRAAEELAHARDAALESSRLKSAFLANMSHEFRTPLNIILGYNDLIGEHLAEMRDSSQSECVEAVARACKRLLHTLNAVLDYSKLESRSFEINPLLVKPVALIRKIIAEMMPQALNKGLTLAFEFENEAVTVIFDEYCLTHALRNLVENALKFTERGGATVRLYRDASDGLCLDVADTGIGIEAAFQPHLLEPFSQEDYGMSRRYEGAGLGLALTRRYLELNGASLTVRSEKGAGSTFTIHFAQVAAADHRSRSLTNSGQATIAPHPQPSIHPMVMVVEDDPDNQILMRAMMKNHYRMMSAASPDEVREQIELYPGMIDLILMDLGLRGPEDGLALTRSLRILKRFRATPIVALTGHTMSVNREQALAAGCNDFIPKPVDRATLFKVIERLLHPLPEIAIDQPPVHS
jgi:PAS domain S-box-containing protein